MCADFLARLAAPSFNREQPSAQGLLRADLPPALGQLRWNDGSVVVNLIWLDEPLAAVRLGVRSRSVVEERDCWSVRDWDRGRSGASMVGWALELSSAD